MHSFIHYVDLYNASSMFLLRSAPDSSTAKTSKYVYIIMYYMYIMHIYVFTIYIYAFYMYNYAYYPALSVSPIIGPYTLTNSVSTNFFDHPQFPFFYKVGVISNGPFIYRSTDRFTFHA